MKIVDVPNDNGPFPGGGAISRGQEGTWIIGPSGPRSNTPDPYLRIFHTQKNK